MLNLQLNGGDRLVWWWWRQETSGEIRWGWLGEGPGVLNEHQVPSETSALGRAT